MYDTTTNRHIAIGVAIERAAKVLPEGYGILIELEQGSGLVTLLLPKECDEYGKVVDDFLGDTFDELLDNAIDMAIEHSEDCRCDSESTTTFTNKE
jgi:hypothetical protein